MRSKSIKKKLVKESWSHFDAIKSTTIQMVVSLTGGRFTPTNITSFSWEVDTTEIIFELVDEDMNPIILNNIRHLNVAWGFATDFNNLIQAHPIFGLGEVIDAEAGLLRTIIPADMLHTTDKNWNGRVIGEIAIRFDDERRFVGGQFLAESRLSLMDVPIDCDVIRWYIRTIDDLLDYWSAQSQGNRDEILAIQRDLGDMRVGMENTFEDLHARQDELLRRFQEEDLVLQGEFQKLLEDVHGIASTEYVMETSRESFDNSRDGKLTDRKIEGVTRVNLMSDRREDFGSVSGTLTIGEELIFFTNPDVTSGSWNTANLLNSMFKASTTYTVLVNLTMTQGIFFQIGQENAIDIFGGGITIHEEGGHVAAFTTRAQPAFDATNQLLLSFRNPLAIAGAQGSAKITILEGDFRHIDFNHTASRQFHSVGEFVDEITVTSFGENLFDGVFVQGSMDAQGNIIPQNNAVVTKNLIPVKPGSTLFGRISNPRNENFVNTQVYNFKGEHIGGITSQTNAGLTTWQIPQGAFYMRARTSTAIHVPIQDSSAVISYNPNLLPTTPHFSQPQSLFYQNEDDQWLSVPKLQGIMDGASPLVVDEVTETEYVQRVVEVDLKTIGIVSIGHGLSNATRFILQTSTIVGTLPAGNGRVMSNRLKTKKITDWDRDEIYVSMGSSGDLTVKIPRNTELTNAEILRQYLIENDYSFLIPLAEPRRYPIRSWDLPSHYPVTNLRIDSGAVSPRFTFSIATSIAQRLALLIERVANLEAWRNEMKLEFDLALANLSAEMLRAEDMILPTNHFHADIPISDYPLGPSGMRIESNALNWPHAGLRVETFRYADNAGVQRAVTMANIEFRRIASGNSWGNWTTVPSQLEIDALVAEIAELKGNAERSREVRKSFGHYVNQELADVKSMTKAFDLVLNDQNQEFKKLASENRRLTKLVDYLCSELAINVEEIENDGIVI